MDCIVRYFSSFKLIHFFLIYRIPPEFPWPKLDKPSSSSTRQPLDTITNRTHHRSRSIKEKTNSIVNSDNNHHFFPTTDHNHFDIQSPHHLTTVYSEQLQVK